MTLRATIGWFLLIGAPAAVISLYLFWSRTVRTFTAASDYAVLAAALAVGAGGILLLARAPRTRAISIAVYLPIAAIAMRVTMTAGCSVFGDCP